MDNMKLNFSKDWRNPADFPTIEPNETQVRADMQLLYTEIQTFLNETLIPAMRQLENPTIDRLPIENEVSGSEARIPTSAAVSKLFSENGNLPTGGAAGQFLVKTGDEYAKAAWMTNTIPSRLSDLVAVDLDGVPVNAQALLTDLSGKIQSTMTDIITPELLAGGVVGNSTVVDISRIGEYEKLWITMSCDGRPSQYPAAIYLGAWNGAWVSVGDGASVVDETGMLQLTNVVFSESGRSQVSAELTMLPYQGGHLVRYQQGMHTENANYHDGLYVRSVFSGEVPDQTKLTLFSASALSVSGMDNASVTYQVFGIRRRTEAEVK